MAQFLTEVDLQIVRLASEIMFMNNLIEAQAEEIRELKAKLEEKEEKKNARR